MLLKTLLILGITLMFVSSGAADASRANLIAKQMGLQGRVVWFDAEANLWELDNRAGVAETIAHCKAAHINTIVLDIKPLCGLVLYNSKIAPHLSEWEGKKYPKGYDLLQTVIEEAHKAGISVHAAMNVFSEGAGNVPGGAAYKNPDWQCVQYEVERFLVGDNGTKMKMTCSNTHYTVGDICLYGTGSKSAGELPPNTTYLRVSADGSPEFCGVATGKARIASPEGGFLLLGTGDAGQWLKDCADNNVRLHIEGNECYLRSGELTDIHNAMFVNPANPEVREYELSIIREICKNYAVDGIVLDRMRYPNIYTDFSEQSRAAFEKFLGQKVQNWPHDVYKRNPIPGDDIIRGPHFKDWVKFRAKVMHDFLAEARETVKSTKPNAKLGIYVGSWYPLYYDVGVNWGGPNHVRQLDWWPDGYEKTGYANLVDYMCTGCYYMHPTRKDAAAAGDEEWKSVEAAAEESINAVDDATFVYGSLYVYQYTNRPDKFIDSIRQCLSKTQGCMIFDLVYLRKYGWWQYLEEVFPAPAKAPHDVPGLIEKVNSGR